MGGKGSKLGDQYVIDKSKKLGGGASANVYEGYHKSNPSVKYAIKEINMDYFYGDTQMVESELKILNECSKLNHPNLIKIHAHYDQTTEEGRGFYYIVMDKCDGGTLEDLIKQKEGKFSEMEVLQITLQISKGLEALHNRLNVIHRDLKPENILRRNGKWVLTDFGLSTQKQYYQSSSGTQAYMAPEYQISLSTKGKSVDI